MQRKNYDIGLADGQVEIAIRLLRVFSDWFEESHKTDQCDRSHSADEISFLWSDAPNFNAVLQTAIIGLRDLHTELENASREDS